MTTTERHAVALLLTEEHLRKMIDDHLLKEEEMGDRVKVARVVQKIVDTGLGVCTENHICSPRLAAIKQVLPAP